MRPRVPELRARPALRAPFTPAASTGLRDPDRPALPTQTPNGGPPGFPSLRRARSETSAGQHSHRLDRKSWVAAEEVFFGVRVGRRFIASSRVLVAGAPGRSGNGGSGQVGLKGEERL